MRRRAFVATVGLVGVSGCLRTTSEPGTQSRSERRAPTDTTTSVTTDGSADATAEPTTEQVGTGSRTLSVLWREPGTAFTVSDGVVYNHNGMRLGAWNSRDGTERWTRDVEQVPFGRPVVSGGTLYSTYRLSGGDSVLRARDASDGAVRWETTVDGTVRSLPLPTGEHLLLNVADWGGEDGDAIVGLRRDTGERRWSQSSGVVSSPGTRRLGTTDADGFAYVTAGTTSASARVSKLDPVTGERRWDWTGATPASEPVFADGAVFLGTYDDVTALDADTGERRWRVETFDTNYAPPTLVGDTVYAGSRDTGVYAIAPGDGTTRWREQVGGGVDALAATADSVAAGHGDELSVLDADGTLALRERYDADVEALSAADGLVFAGAGHETVAYEVSTR